MEVTLEKILTHYFDSTDQLTITPLEGGLINATFKVVSLEKSFILQKINTAVFPDPEQLVRNILQVSDHLNKTDYPNEVIQLVPNLKGELLTYTQGGVWRMTDFIDRSTCFQQVQSLEQAFEAAKALGLWHRYCFGMNLDAIQPGIVDFLAYDVRMKNFHQALENTSDELIQSAQSEINYLLEHQSYLQNYTALQLPQRLIHTDAKISNFLFSETDFMHPIALIDWDTLMTGSVLVDFGDMVRTFSNLNAEDDPNPINSFSPDYYLAIKKGFLYHLEDRLKPIEMANFELTAFVVVYIQAVRFLTDYLQGNPYYTIQYAKQNLNRTINQINWLKAMQIYQSNDT